MRSVRRRRSESSTAASMFAADRPFLPSSDPSLVAMTTSSRRFLEASHSPMIVSDSPPEFPGIQAT